MRRGFNTHKYQLLDASKYCHQLNASVYKRYQQEYFSGGTYSILFKKNEL